MVYVVQGVINFMLKYFNIKKLICFIISLIALIIGLLVIVYAEENSIIGLSVFLTSLISILIELCWNNLRKLLKKEKGWKSTLSNLLKERKINKEDYIRISFAYLYRINVNGSFLLVKNGRNILKYQPVGGAYKCTPEEKAVLTGKKYGVVDDDFIGIDETSKDDYRMRVPARNLKKFVRRFIKTKLRENIEDLSREFKEELIVSKILPKKHFKQIEYKFCGRHYTDLRFSTYNECYELLIADIVELMPTDIQKMVLVELQKIVSDEYIWATEKDILTCGVKKSTVNMSPNITDHSFKILPVKEKELIEYKERQYLVNIK